MWWVIQYKRKDVGLDEMIGGSLLDTQYLTKSVLLCFPIPKLKKSKAIVVTPFIKKKKE